MARILDISPISNTARMLFQRGTLQFLQDSYKNSLSDIVLSQIGDGNIDLGKAYILYGCKNTGTYPNYNISAGAVWFLGEIYEVDANIFAVTGGNVAVMKVVTTQYTTDADPTPFSDASTHNIHNIRKVKIEAGTSGSGISDYADAVFGAVRYQAATEDVFGVIELATQAETDAGLDDTTAVTPSKLANTTQVPHVTGGTYITSKVLSIGDWDMDTNALKTITHGIPDITKLISVNVTIIRDDSLLVAALDSIDSVSLDGTVNGGVYGLSTTDLVLNRIAGKLYDSADYSNTPFNRGFVTITYFA